MTTVINNPGGQGDSNDSGAGLIIGVIIAIILIALFVIYGLPALRDQPVDNKNETTNINVEIPNEVLDTNTTE